MATPNAPSPLLRYLIPPGCQERFLGDGGTGSQALRSSQLASAGLSDLEAPYDILRTPCAIDHAVLLTLQGEGRVRIAGMEHALTPGSICFLPAPCEHHYWTPSRWSMLWFHPARCARWDRLIQEARIGWGHGIPDLTALAELFLAERTRGRPDSPWILESLAKAMGLFLEREAAGHAPGPGSAHASRVEALWKAVAERPHLDWNLRECARACGLGTRTLQLAVSQLKGFGVSDGVARIRMEQARALLEHTDWKLEDVAERVGYRNPFAFSRAFKRAVGQSPSTYRADRRMGP